MSQALRYKDINRYTVLTNAEKWYNVLQNYENNVLCKHYHLIVPSGFVWNEVQCIASVWTILTGTIYSRHGQKY